MIDDNRQEENIFIPNYHNNKLKKVTFNLIIFYMFIWFRINYSFPLVKCKFITLFCKKKKNPRVLFYI